MKKQFLLFGSLICFFTLGCEDDIQITEKEKINNGHEYVDLGLSVMWATCNIDATKPEEYGTYYAWGETETKSDYSSDRYKYFWESSNNIFISKYNYSSRCGSIDGNITILPDYDVAYKKWKGSWRIPTEQEFEELLNNCSWRWTTQNGVTGYLVTSKRTGYTDQSIFLPTTGVYYGSTNYRSGTYGCYWSSSLSAEDPFNAYQLVLTNDKCDTISCWRPYGLAIRPVFPSESWDGEVSISLNKEEITLPLFRTDTITAIISNSIHDYKHSKKWYSSNTDVATVSSDGIITTKSHGTATITVKCLNKSASCVIKVVDPQPVKEMVDLGLSANWATCNVGAPTPYDIGYYYAWGEIKTKAEYTWIKYRFYAIKDKNNKIILSKYTYKNYDGYTYDEKNTLDMEDDVAHVLWGDNWRIPTADECSELIANCTWTWTSINGVNGYIVTSNRTGYTDRSIFLPAAGCKADDGLVGFGTSGSYMSDTIKSTYESLSLSFGTVNQNVHASYRYIGQSVRPVVKSNTWEGITSFSLNADSMTLYVGSVDTLKTIIKSGNDIVNYDVSWSSSNTDVLSINKDGIIKALLSGEAIVTAECRGKKATCVVKVNNYSYNNFEYVDLGLSVKWATINIGASNLEDEGNLFAWGEVESKSSFSWSNYKYSEGDWANSLTKYCNSAEYGNDGYVDDLNYLTATDDAAQVIWGGGWRIPTLEEVEELQKNCEVKNIIINGHSCRKIISKVTGYYGVYIIMPYTRYWVNSISNDPNYAVSFSNQYGVYINKSYRCDGLSIRPVCP